MYLVFRVPFLGRFKLSLSFLSRGGAAVNCISILFSFLWINVFSYSVRITQFEEFIIPNNNTKKILLIILNDKENFLYHCKRRKTYITYITYKKERIK